MPHVIWVSVRRPFEIRDQGCEVFRNRGFSLFFEFLNILIILFLPGPTKKTKLPLPCEGLDQGKISSWTLKKGGFGHRTLKIVVFATTHFSTMVICHRTQNELL